MALATYDELALALESWINRDDLAGQIPVFVALCESRLNRLLRVGAMEREADLEPAADGAGYALPDDFLELRSLVRPGEAAGALRPLSPETLGETGGARGYVIAAGRIRLTPEEGDGGALRAIYYAALPPLAQAGSNWLLLRHPDVYLYGALAEAEGFVRNEEKLALWRSLQEAALEQILAEDRGARWSGGLLAPEPALALR